MPPPAAPRRFKNSGTRGPLDMDLVRASRNFHLKHWAQGAMEAIRKDHRKMLYGWLEPNLQATIAAHEGGELPADSEGALLADLAFIEGHLQAFREILQRAEQLSRVESSDDKH